LSFTGGSDYYSVNDPTPNTVGWTFNLADSATLFL